MPQGLIPLMLNADSAASLGSRSSVLLRSRQIAKPSASSPTLSPTSSTHRRNASDMTPMIKLSRPPVRAIKRSSQQVPASLPVLPFTSAEWKKAIAEIKRYHVTRRYRACSARCNEILTNIKDSSRVEPAYLIYLEFYVATSLEMCARPLQPASSYRTSLLEQARDHYQRAYSLIQAAEEAAMSSSRCSSVASSLPSLHSPSGSVSSRAWTPEDGVMTPTCLLPERKSSLQQGLRSSESYKKPKKKVSFELPKDKDRWSFRLPEPVIRPDSPTLGFDDEYFAAGAMRRELPEPPTKRSLRQDFDTDRIDASPLLSPPMPSINEAEELSPTSSASSTSDSSENCVFSQYDSGSDSESTRSLARYYETLSSLKTQVTSHMSSLDSLLESDVQLQQQELPDSPVLHDVTSMITANFNRMTLNSYDRQRSGSSMSFSSHGSSGGEEDEARIQDRKARVDKLRMNGWKRKRFDASRYEELCEVVLAELEDHN